MKKMLAILLTLCLFTGLFAALAEETPAAEAGLPAVGDVVNGFEALEIRSFPMIDADVVLFEHQKTGAKLMYIANDDTNRVFDLTFLTVAVDNTGLPHVFEHSTLDGSEKYPSKALFFNLIYQTYNSYMNAATYPRMTTYPVGSLSEAQLLKYADYYTDSCLHPMILEDESIFREEAWRYRLESEEGELTIEGTVYSEMLGALDLNGAAANNALRAAFPGSTIGNEYGGEPAHIPEMTWQMLKDYHDEFYHPSNCIAYLYGEYEDYAAFLQLLDEAFSPYEKREFSFSDEGYTPITEPVFESYAFPVEAGSSTENAATAYYYIVCPGVDAQQELILNTLTDLMLDEASVLQQSLKQALPAGSFACYIDTNAPDKAIVFTASNINREDAPLFQQTVDAALQDIAANGFPQDLVDSVMATLTIQNMLSREDSSVGVETVIPNLAYSYAASGNPWDFMDYVDGLAQMDEWNQQGLYAKAVSDWLLDKSTTALSVTYPEPGLKEQEDAALAAHLAEVKAAMSDEEIAALVAAANADEEEDDASAYVAQLQAVTVDSLPEEIKEYDVSDETDDAGVRHIEAVAGVDGIGQVSLFLDASGIPQEDLHWFKLFTALPGQMDTSAHTRAELAALSGRYLNGRRIYVSLPRIGEDFNPYLRLTWIGLDDDLATGYDLMREMIFDMNLDDTQRILETVQSAKASLKNSITSAPYNVQLDRAMAVTDDLYLYYTYVNDLEYYAFLEQVEQLIAEDPAAVTAKLQGIRDTFDNRENAVAVYAGSPESIALNRPLADAFMASLDRRPIERAQYDLPRPAASEGLIVDSSVQFNGLFADYAALGLDGYTGELDAVTSLVTDTFLYPMLRDQYGSYGVFHSAIQDDGIYAISYRDPNVAQTFDVYAQLYDLVTSLDVDQETLDGYILSAYASYAMPSGELTGAVDAAMNVLEGTDGDDALETMRQLKAVTPEAIGRFAGMYQALTENGVRFSAGAASAINANADLYEVILNPFGARDNSQVTLSDVSEDDPQYEAVRFAFENGFMQSLTDDTFGVAEPATYGDVLTAVYVLIGGAPDADEALSVLAGYGLVPEGLDLTEAASSADASALLGALTEEGWDYPESSLDPMTRGDFATLLQAFMADLEG